MEFRPFATPLCLANGEFRIHASIRHPLKSLLVHA